MAFETRPIDLGNTLARVANIQNARSSNELNKLNLEKMRQSNQITGQINQALQGGVDPNELAQRFGLPGLDAASKMAEVQAAFANLNAKQLETAIENGRLVNNMAINAKNSKNPAQATMLAMKNPLIRDFVQRVSPQFDPTVLSAEELNRSLDAVIEQTSMFNDPQAISRLVSGTEATAQGFSPGTVVEETVEKGKVTNRQVLQKPPTAGLSVEVGPDGGVTFKQGGPATGDLTKPTVNKLQAEVKEMDDQLASLSSIGQTFEPEFQQISGRFEAMKTAVKSKAGVTVSQAEADQLNRFATFRRNSIEALNRYIKLITGAQMSEAEANRLRQGFPDPGDGLFDGDDPITFQAKYKATMKQLRLARSRRAWALNNGRVAPDVGEAQLGSALERVVTLEAFEANINARAEQLTQEFMQNQGMNQQTARQQAFPIVKQEFNL